MAAAGFERRAARGKAAAGNGRIMAYSNIITLTTDFGEADHLVAVMRGVILSINPEAKLVDICHQIKAFDVWDGAFTLGEACAYFPPGTIHVVVVDPGVGSRRRPLLARTPRHAFIAPDNGVLSLVCGNESPVEVRHITKQDFFRQPASATFHGRDVFAPCAAWLSRNVAPEKFGPVIEDYLRLQIPAPRRMPDGALEGVILRADRFGNLMTNFTLQDAPELGAPTPPPVRLLVNSILVTRMVEYYGMGRPGEPFLIVGSSGYLEVSVNRGSATQALGADAGAAVRLVIGGEVTP